MPNSQDIKEVIHNLAVLARNAAKRSDGNFTKFLENARGDNTPSATPYVAYVFFLWHKNRELINRLRRTQPNFIYDELQKLDRINEQETDAKIEKENRQAQAFFNALFTNINYLVTLRILTKKQISLEHVSRWSSAAENYRNLSIINPSAPELLGTEAVLATKIKQDAQTELSDLHSQAIKTDLVLLARFAKRRFPSTNRMSSFSVFLEEIQKNDSTATNIAAYMIHLMQQLSHSNQSLQEDELKAILKDVYYRNSETTEVKCDFTSDIIEDTIFFTDFSNTQNQVKILDAIKINNSGDTLVTHSKKPPTNPLKIYNKTNPGNQLLTVEFTPQYLANVKATMPVAKVAAETKAIEQAKTAAIKLLESKHSRLSSIRTNNKENKQLKQLTLDKLNSANTLEELDKILDKLKNDWKPRYHAVFFKRAQDNTETDTFKKVEEIQNEYSELLGHNPAHSSAKFS